MEGVDEVSNTCYDENTYKRDGTDKSSIMVCRFVQCYMMAWDI